MLEISDYRIAFFEPEGYSLIRCTDDEQAVAVARRLAEQRGFARFEVWQGERRIPVASEPALAL